MRMRFPFFLALVFVAYWATGTAQVVEDFDIRFQAQQNGGIQFLANTTMYCGGSFNCTEAQRGLAV